MWEERDVAVKFSETTTGLSESRKPSKPDFQSSFDLVFVARVIDENFWSCNRIDGESKFFHRLTAK